MTSNILTDINYSSKGVYWLGGEVNTKNGHYEWSDGSPMNFQVTYRQAKTGGDPPLALRRSFASQWPTFSCPIKLLQLRICMLHLFVILILLLLLSPHPVTRPPGQHSQHGEQ